MTDEKDLDLSDIFKAIGKRIILILFFSLIGLGAAVFYNYTAPLKYESRTTLYVQPKVSSSGDVDYETLLSSQRLVKTYTQIIKSRSIINQVKEILVLDLSYSEIINSLTVSSLSDTEIISITVKTDDPKLASEIANTIAEVFINEIKSTMEISNIRIIDEAITDRNPVEPNILKNSVMGLAAGLILGLVLAFLLESMDNKIKNHEDIKRYLKIKTLGVIPHDSIEYENVDKKKKKNIVNSNVVDLQIVKEPTSIISESIRMLRTNLNFLDLKVLNVTSTVASEGKTEVISNTAVAFAMLGKKVLIVDCDLRRPKIHKKFGISRQYGVSDIVLSHGVNNYKEVIQTYKTGVNDVSIDILPAGSKISNSSELINSTFFAKLIKEVSIDYDLVLLDCPPISMITDGVLVSKLADGTIYIIESDRTDYQVIGNCIEDLQNNKAFVLGAVLTKVNIKREKKLYGYKYDYYYSDHRK
ncbi:MAG: polysaccharide biosynthesis tyrosine autokinase [Bacilli bacterium]